MKNRYQYDQASSRLAKEEKVKRIAYKREERTKTEEKRDETREEKLWKSRKT